MPNGKFKSRWSKTMARIGQLQSPPRIKTHDVCVAAKNYDAGFGSALTVDAATGVAGTETPAEVAGTGTACRE